MSTDNGNGHKKSTNGNTARPQLAAPWPKGVSGNPNGRPPMGNSPVPWIRLLANTPRPGDPNKHTWAQAVANAVYAAAIEKSDMQAAKLIFERIEPHINITAIEGLTNADVLEDLRRTGGESNDGQRTS